MERHARRKPCIPGIALVLLAVFGGGDAAAQDVPVGDKDLGPRVRERLGAKRLALVIGINDYHDPAIEDLRFAEADAVAVHGILKEPLRGGFAEGEVTLLVGNEATTRNVRAALEKIKRNADEETFVLVFFSGHGVNIGGEACWVTQDAEAGLLPATAIENSTLRTWFDAVRSKRLVVLVDACHAAATMKTGEKAFPSVAELRNLYKGEGRVILGSCDPTQKSLEDETLRHGIFTAALRDALIGGADEAGNKDGVNSMDEVWEYVSRNVAERARRLGKTQTPVRFAEDEKATGRFLVTANTERLRALERERAAVSATARARIAKLKALINEDRITGHQYEEGKALLEAPEDHLDEARRRRRDVFAGLADGRLDPGFLAATLAGLGSPPPAPPAGVQPDGGKPPAPSNPPSGGKRVPTWAEVIREDPDPAIVKDAGVRSRIAATGFPWRVKHRETGMEFLLVLPGEYRRGASPGDDEAESDENPAHRVTITKPFYLGRFELTNAEFRDFQPGHASGKFENLSLDAHDQPAVNVSWNEADAYARRYSMRLPTEAEWEYAARGGTTWKYFWGQEANQGAGFANMADAAARQKFSNFTHAGSWNDGFAVTSPVGRLAPNGFGLHDMIGNVWEWCADWYDERTYEGCRNGVTDPTGPSSGGARLLRGGSWYDIPWGCRVSFRRERPG